MYPILGYRDLAAAIDWLCRVFSFQPLEIMRDEGGAYVHVELRLGDGLIMPTTQSEDPDAGNPWDQPLTTQGLYVALDGVDAHYDRAVREGAEILRPLADTDYGPVSTPRATWRGTLELRHIPAGGWIAGSADPRSRSHIRFMRSTGPQKSTRLNG